MGDLPVLLNPLVLEKVLSYSDNSDLANHRLVCKTWFEVWLTRWRSTSTLNVLQSPMIPGTQLRQRGVTLAELRKIFTTNDDEEEESSTASSSYKFLKLDTKPFSRFRLKRFYFGGKLEPQKFPEFWEKIGPLMTHVHLDQFAYSEHEVRIKQLRDLLDIIFELTPNLVGLKMTKNVFRRGRIIVMGRNRRSRLIERGIKNNSNARQKPSVKEFFLDEQLPFRLGDLLEYFPNLERLTFHNFHSRSLRITLAELERMEVKPSLKHLDILHDSKSDGKSFDEVINPRDRWTRDFRYAEDFGKHVFPLKSLSLGTCSSNVDNFMGAVRKILERFSTEAGGNLEILKLYAAPFQDHQPTLVQDALRIFAGRGTNNFVARNLTDFYVDYKFGVESLKTLTSWMPNLSSFSGILNNETIRVVFEQWKDLRDLKCFYGSTVDDEGIVGFGLGSTSGTESPSKKKIKLETEPFIVKELLNITSLTKLQTFKYEAYCRQGKLGDRSALDGFLKMGVLQTLDICVSPQLSQWMETRLKETIRNVKINRNYDEDKRNAHEGPCCQRVEFLLYMAVKGAKPEEIPEDLAQHFRRLK